MGLTVMMLGTIAYTLHESKLRIVVIATPITILALMENLAQMSQSSFVSSVEKFKKTYSYTRET